MPKDLTYDVGAVADIGADVREFRANKWATTLSDGRKFELHREPPTVTPFDPERTTYRDRFVVYVDGRVVGFLSRLMPIADRLIAIVAAID